MVLFSLVDDLFVIFDGELLIGLWFMLYDWLFALFEDFVCDDGLVVFVWVRE